MQAIDQKGKPMTPDPAGRPDARREDDLKPKIGQGVRVKREFLSRGGQEGVVTDVFDDGVEVDFFTCGMCGATRCVCYTSLEFWRFDELEPWR
jgi:hypothetical protein